jgi:hypothetical protein
MHQDRKSGATEVWAAIQLTIERGMPGLARAIGPGRFHSGAPTALPES